MKILGMEISRARIQKRFGIGDFDKIIDWYYYGLQPDGELSVTPDTALYATAVLACIRVLSEDLAKLSCVTYRKMNESGSKRARAQDHYLYPLLHAQPNPEMTAFEFFELQQIHFCLRGNAFINIKRSPSGEPYSLVPIHPDRIKANRTEKGEVIYSVWNRGQYDPAPFDSISHLRSMAINGIMGTSLVQLAKEAIALSLYGERFSSRTFRNNAAPGGVIEYPGKLNPDARKNFLEAWDEKHKGVANAARPAMLQEGMKWVNVGTSPRDAQMLEERTFQILEICRVFRMQPHKIAELSRATYSNIEWQAIEHVQDTLLPHARRWEQVISRDLLFEAERNTIYAEFLFDSLLRGDTTARWAAYTSGFNVGAFSQNDILERENINPFDGGDEHYVPLNMVPIGTEFAASVTPLMPPPMPRSLEERSAMLKKERAARTVAGRKRVAAIYRKLFVNAATDLIRHERDKVLEAAGKQLRSAVTDDFADWMDEFYVSFQEYIRRKFHPLMLAYGEEIAALAAEGIGVEVKMTTQLEKFIKEYVNVFALRYAGSSQGQLADVLTKAGAEGINLFDSIAQRIGEWELTRPGKVADNEVVRQGNAVAREVYRDSGVTKLQWVASGASSCPYCQSLDGKIVGIEETFVDKMDDVPGESGKSMTTYHDTFAPPIHEGCDCSILAV